MSVNIESIPCKGHQRLLKLADFLDTLPEDGLNMLSWFRVQRDHEVFIGVISGADVQLGEDTGVFARQDEHTFSLASNVTVDTMKDCRFAACAIGWAGTIPEFIAEGFSIRAKWTPGDVEYKAGSAPVPRYNQVVGYDAVEVFFELSSDHLSDEDGNGETPAAYLFGPDSYGEVHPHPSEVAQRIRQFVSDHQWRFTV